MKPVLVTLMEILRILLRITRPYSFTFLDIVYRLIFGPKPVLPPIEDVILLMPATELAENIRRKELKSEDAVKAYIKRIKEVDPLINACEEDRFEEALKEAKRVDSFISSETATEVEIEKDTPLLGVPFTAKDIFGVKGLAQTSGLYRLKDFKAERDGRCISLLRKSGAIPLAVTHVSESSMWWEAVNPFVRVYNPYDNVRTSGGSSGGQAAMIAYAGAVFGVGNDLAGSIRVPAAFNGIYAHNGSEGVISNDGWPLLSDEEAPFVRTGPLCRFAKDLPMLANILSEGRIQLDKKVDFRKVKIYYMEEFPGYLIKPIPDIKRAVYKAAKHFEEAYSNKPIKIRISELKYAAEIFRYKLLETGKAPFRDVLEENGPINLFLEFLKIIFKCGEHTIPSLYYALMDTSKKGSDYHKFLAMFDVLKKKMDSFLTGDAILLIPTHPEPALHHLMSIPKFPNKAYTSIINFLGYPSTQIPAGLSNGLPIGIQVLSMKNNDHLCILTAIELENLFGGWICPSKITA